MFYDTQSSEMSSEWYYKINECEASYIITFAVILSRQFVN